MAVDGNDQEGVRAVEVTESLDAATQCLQAAWAGGSRAQSMALVIATMAAHGRMSRYLEGVEYRRQADPVMLARVRWCLEGQVDAVKANTRSVAIAIGRCHMYLNAARTELQRVTEAVIENQWQRSGEFPGRWARRDATAP